MRKVKRSGRRRLSPDPARLGGASGSPQRSGVEWGTVGHTDDLTGLPEPTPAFVRVEAGQFFVEVTVQPHGDQIVARLAMQDADVDSGTSLSLTFGSRVLLAFVGGSTQNAVIIGRFHDVTTPLPNTIGLVPTGAAGGIAPGAMVPAPTWNWIKTAAGQLLAIETGVGGDVVIHSGGSVEIKALDPIVSAIHLNGRVALGGMPVSPPVGSMVGPAGTQIPGTPSVAQPYIPAVVPPIPAPPLTIVPLVAMPDSIVRAKDAVQSHAAVDPQFWTFIVGVYTHPIILALLAGAGITMPISLHSEHGGKNGPGSKHTASD